MPREPRHERFWGFRVHGRQSPRRLRSGTRALHRATTTTATTTTKCYSCATTAITTSTTTTTATTTITTSTTSTKIIGFE
jgi:hypothetical protein